MLASLIICVAHKAQRWNFTQAWAEIMRMRDLLQDLLKQAYTSVNATQTKVCFLQCTLLLVPAPRAQFLSSMKIQTLACFL